MNNKARKVRQSTIDRFAGFLPAEDLYVTRTIEQSDECLKEILVKKYPLVFCGGGDGTAMRIIEQLLNHVRTLNAAGGDYALPRIGILKLGTGNGWAGLLNTPPAGAPIEYIKKAGQPKFTRFNMLRFQDRLAHMAGIGIDAAILNDYIDFKKKFAQGFFWKIANSLFGYLFTIFAISIPRFITKGARFNVRVYNDSDDPVYKIAHSTGAVELPWRKGDKIFEGNLMMVGFGTTPNYGFNLVALPHALAKPGYMTLRLVASSIPRVLSHIPSVWAGRWEHETVHDYLVKRVRIESDQDLPLQLGGDPEGYRRELVMDVAEETVEVLDFRGVAGG